jgi:opacity protein-like surface antigen
MNIKFRRSDRMKDCMKKGMFIVFASVMCVLLMTSTGLAQNPSKKFTLKASGGYGSISGGDLTTIAGGLNEQLADIARLAGASASGEIKNAKWGPEFEGEFVYNFTERWGVGLGVGYIRKSVESGAQLRLGTYAGVSFDWEPVYKVIPVTLNGYYNFPVASKVNAYVKGGAGYYFATWDYKIRQENELLGITVWEENEGTAKDSGFGFQGGLGFAYSLSDSVALFLEGSGRFVNLKNWDVENVNRNALGTDSETGSFWYLEEYEEDTGKYYPSLELSDDEPSDPDNRNVRKAEISLSGIVFKLGVIFRF